MSEGDGRTTPHGTRRSPNPADNHATTPLRRHRYRRPENVELTPASDGHTPTGPRETLCHPELQLLFRVGKRAPAPHSKAIRKARTASQTQRKAGDRQRNLQ